MDRDEEDGAPAGSLPISLPRASLALFCSKFHLSGSKVNQVGNRNCVIRVGSSSRSLGGVNVAVICAQHIGVRDDDPRPERLGCVLSHVGSVVM